MMKLNKRFDRNTLARVCAMPELAFPYAYGMDTVKIQPDRWRDPDDSWYAFRDNGSAILAVAHLDTVAPARTRACHFLNTESGEVVYSRALDDRLGAYIVLEWLPALGIRHDVLLTVGEETGQSTAEFFRPDKDYDWIIEFDRGGTDVVMYQYEDAATNAAVEASGARVGNGILSDISYMEHLGVKAFNWGVGYRDYHGPRAHAYLDDTTMMVRQYLKFHAAQAGHPMAHVPHDSDDWWDWGNDGLVLPRCREDEEPDIFDPDYADDNPSNETVSRVLHGEGGRYPS